MNYAEFLKPGWAEKPHGELSSSGNCFVIVTDIVFCKAIQGLLS